MKVVVLAVLVVAVSSVLADPQTADRLEAEAEQKGAAKDYLGAAAKFREAYAADPRPYFICNVGIAYHRLPDPTRAQLFLSRCLERGTTLEGKFLADVRGLIGTIEATLKSGSFTPVDIVVEPRFATVAIGSFAADETFDGGRTVWLRHGKHRVTVRAEGYVEQTVDVDAKDRTILPVRVALVKQPVDTGSATPPPVGSGSAERPPPPPPSPRTPSKLPAIGATIATVALGAFAIYAASTARDHADQAQYALRDQAFEDEVDSMDRWNTIFVIDLALVGVGAVASGYLWYRALDTPASVEVSPQGATITFRTRF